MRLLQIGCTGADVWRWQAFLRGQGLYLAAVDSIFGPKSRDATIAFQTKHGVRADGVVDNLTVAAAILLGFGVVHDGRDDRTGPNWPLPPFADDLQPLTQEGRAALFGAFPFKPRPTTSNPEAIEVSSSWVLANIVSVKIPLINVGTGALVQKPVAVHKLAAEKLVRLFETWLAVGLIDRVLTWDGSYAPRFIRGSTRTLSAHAWGSAFDINARWNALGAVPALLGKRGCVRELVAHANAQGWYWGGHYKSRADGMHFELVTLDEAFRAEAPTKR